MDDNRKTKEQLIQELEDLRRRMAEFERSETEHKRAFEVLREIEDETKHLVQENAIMAKIGRIVSSSLDINEVYEPFAKEVRKLIPFDRIGINTLDVVKGMAVLAYVAGKGISDREVGVPYSVKGTAMEEMINTKSVVLVQTDDLNEIKHRFPKLLSTFQSGFRSILNVPLLAKGQVIGTLLLRSVQSDAYKTKDLQLAEKVGRQIAGAIANAQLYIELERAEKALRESESKLQELFDNAPVGYHELDTDGRITRVNRTEMKMLGYTAEEMLGRPGWEFIVEEEISRQSVIAKFAGTKQLMGSFERTCRRKDGTTFPVLIKDRLLQNSEGKIRGIRSTIQDITEQKRAEVEKEILETQLWQARKAESLGRMAGAIAHQYNNLLSIVMGNLDLTLLELPEGSRFRDSINEAMKASRRAAEISHLMLAYLGQSLREKEPLDLSVISRQVRPSMTALMPEKVDLKIESPSSGPVIRANEGQMKQVFSSLVTNAIEAIGDQGGTITLSIGVVKKSSIRESLIHPAGWKPGAETYACLSIADTGCGMDSETSEKAFDPFFSTKFVGRGLGLAVVAGVVKAHEGAVEMESVPGQGTTIRVILPLMADHSLSAPKVPAMETGTGDRRGLVLLVEDDPRLRDLAQRMLLRLGYDSIPAADGIEVLEVFRQRQNEISCVLLDLTMPRMGGWETLEALRKLRPDLLVILASGYDEAQVMEGEHSERPQTFLHKPYTLDNLKAALAAILKERL